jgi:hypothetical protein
MAKEIVLIAGLNYPEYKSSPSGRDQWNYVKPVAGPWREFSVRWARNAFQKDNTLKITLFDFFKGTRENIKFGKKSEPIFTLEETPGALDFTNNYRRLDVSGGSFLFVEPEKTIKSSFRPQVSYFTGVSEVNSGPVNVDDYKAKFIEPGSSPPAEKSISIVNIYDYITDEIASKRPGTLSEFHIFSHAWAGGPILVNTFDSRSTFPERDYLDKDGRTKDFDSINMIVTEFKKAFDQSASTFVWGCHAFGFMKTLIHETIRQKKTVKDPTKKALQFVHNSDWNSSVEYFHSELGGSGGKSNLLSTNDIRDKVRESLKTSYMDRLAKASGARVLGGLPGTYSDYDTKGKTSELFLHIPMGAPFGDEQNFQSVLTFYKDIVGVGFDPSQGMSKVFGRGFGVFQP